MARILFGVLAGVVAAIVLASWSALPSQDVRLEGAISDALGRPVSGAAVEVISGGLKYTARTGPEGIYGVSVPPGPAIVAVRYPGDPAGSPATFTVPSVTLSGARMRLEFPPPGQKARIMCKREDGRFASGLRILAKPAGANAVTVCAGARLADPSTSSYILPGLPQGPCAITVLGAERLSLVEPSGASVLFVRAGSADPAATLTFSSQTGALEVKTATAGSGRSGVSVVAARAGAFVTADTLRRARTDSSGVARFEDLPAGRYWVAAEIPGTESLRAQPDGRQGPLYAFVSGGSTVAPGGLAQASIELPASAMGGLHGRVLNASGSAVAGARVAVLSGPNAGTVAGERWAPTGPPKHRYDLGGTPPTPLPTAPIRITDANGAFQFSALPAGEYRVAATTPDGSNGVWRTVRIGPGGSAELELRWGSGGASTTGVVSPTAGTALPLGLVVYALGSQSASYCPVGPDGSFRLVAEGSQTQLMLAELGTILSIPARATRNSDGTWRLEPQWR